MGKVVKAKLKEKRKVESGPRYVLSPKTLTNNEEDLSEE